ncbi:uncharacterized protein LOC105398799 [Plutella xylostella]|uniref:uncharacterized protein LOC105398799 n=1 Tax=Plutella xylostella TaxID=51655 RepID=UPI002032765C|nr:uncharacterized protein LOC105398799 [Plutella xylostella]
MVRRYIVCLCILSCLHVARPQTTTPAAPSPAPAAPAAAPRADVAEEDPPEGYYAFVESPNATPPRVRPPPYRQVSTDCSEARDPRPHVTANNLCGDLNRGVIPRNPMGHSLNGEPYPFELLRNLTLKFLSRTLPVLRADDTLPRVTHLTHNDVAELGPSWPLIPHILHRVSDRYKRSASADLPVEHREEPRDSRKFCDNGGVFCMLYRAINGDSSSAGVERREDPGPPPHAPHQPPPPRYEGPPTPCPARVEYATPVFARNYQGVWRYVVQIPYEGYFTQTVEVTRCMQSRCHYLDGGCLSSPRWVSLLVAELHYPGAAATPAPAPQPADFQDYQQYLQKRAGQPSDATSTEKPAHCDGHDELGCYQVRLYYDWFLVPGSCKCWRPDYFARYVRRRHSTTEL